ncbi:LIM domain protein [Dictyocaulus viviparus]|uniref:LIM domain protein n=1 Tax=Dictyocaulus viviparus TaxID=29172 RepID=A0A0D8XRY6_DICVI|nr:LIM domain protein [Dictyocaulus viviparus]
MQKKWHPTCFTCAHCRKPFGNTAFYLENGLAYCENAYDISRLVTPSGLNLASAEYLMNYFKTLGKKEQFFSSYWNALFTTKCVACKYPIEAGDRWVEALGNAFHSNCFNCTHIPKNESYSLF